MLNRNQIMMEIAEITEGNEAVLKYVEALLDEHYEKYREIRETLDIAEFEEAFSKVQDAYSLADDAADKLW